MQLASLAAGGRIEVTLDLIAASSFVGVVNFVVGAYFAETFLDSCPHMES